MSTAWRGFTALLATVLCLLTSAPAAAQATPPRVALVLSGGGARGFAHVGVMRALQQLGVPVDIVVGASMGAVVGGAFAAGRSVQELELFVRQTDWDSVVADRPQRNDLSFRRKEDDLEVPSRIEFGIARGGVLLPPSAVGNAALETALAQLLPADALTRPAGSLPLRFVAVATDLLTGELVELAQTPLLLSLRASMAVPGVFAPVRVNQRLVVDGGLVRNLPVDLAKALGAEVVIAVNVGTPLAGESALGSALGVAQQMLNILTEQNVRRSLQELGPQDILIAPDLGSISLLDFRAGEQAMAAGERATLALAERLRPLAVSREVYAVHESNRAAPRADTDAAKPLARLDVRGTEHADARALAAQTGLEIGQGITLAGAQRAAATLFGRGDFERVEVDLHDGPGGRELVITPTEAPWARSRLRIGLELSSDFRDDHRFAVSGLHVLSWLNSWGGELRSIARFGSQRGFGTQWWQPLGAGSAWYATTAVQYDSESLDLFSGGRRLSRASLSSSSFNLAAGRQLGAQGDLRLGVIRSVGRGRVLLPTPVVDDARDFSETKRFVLLRYDSLESLAFPTRGQLLIARWEQQPATRTGQPSLAQSSVQGLAAFHLGEWGGHLYAEWAKSPSGFAPVALGGFLRLTGTPRDSVNGATTLLGRAVLARRIGQMPPGLGGAIRSGLSLELGEGFAATEAVRAARLRPAGSAFVSVDTRFGPAYLALGATRASGTTVYVFLGPFW